MPKRRGDGSVRFDDVAIVYRDHVSFLKFLGFVLEFVDAPSDHAFGDIDIGSREGFGFPFRNYGFIQNLCINKHR
jgi:hypothetical protein